MSVEIAWKQNILVTDSYLLKLLLVVFGFGLQAFICGFSRQNICSVDGEKSSLFPSIFIMLNLCGATWWQTVELICITNLHTETCQFASSTNPYSTTKTCQFWSDLKCSTLQQVFTCFTLKLFIVTSVLNSRLDSESLSSLFSHLFPAGYSFSEYISFLLEYQEKF